METKAKRRNGNGAPAASDLEAARTRIAEAVNLPPPPSNPFNTSESDTVTLARAVVELAAVLEVAR